MAGRTAAYGRACYHWAVKRGSLSANPFQDLPLEPVAKRDRVLSDDELRAVWNATAGPGSFNSIVRVLILTGQRQEEVAGMTWEEIAPDLSTWTIAAARAKNGVTHIVPLSPHTQTILKAAHRRDQGAAAPEPEFVFPGQRSRFNGFGKSKAVLDKASGAKNWRLHDVRRTVATGLQKLSRFAGPIQRLLFLIPLSQAIWGSFACRASHRWLRRTRR